MAGVLDLQRTVGNQAVAAAAAAGDLWRMAVAQREPAAAATGPAKEKPADDLAEVIVEGLDKAIKARRETMEHLPAGEADAWIGVIDAYARTHRKRTDIIPLFHDAENLYELLAPWGFVGRSFRYEEGRNVVVPAPAVENLLQSIAIWKGEDARTRKKRRAQTHSTFGMYDRDRSAAEVYYDDQQRVAGGNRSDPSEPMGPDYEGTRAERRSERERLKNEHAMGMIEGIASQGPGGFAGMVAGGLIGMIPGVDFHKATEVGMAVGSVADALLMTGAEMAPSGGAGGGGNQAHAGEMAGPRQEMEKPDVPGSKPGGGGAAGRTMHGMGAAGPAGEGAAPREESPGQTTSGMGAAGPAGVGAAPRSQPGKTMPGMGAVGGSAGGGRARGGATSIRAGAIAEVKPDDVKAMHGADPNMVRHSASDSWHQIQWNDALQESGQWNPMDGPAPKAPMAFRYKGGMIQVNDLQWVKEGRPIAEIIRDSQRGGGAAEAPVAAAGVGSGTQAGHAPGPGQTEAGAGGPKGPRSGDTEVGHAPGPGGVQPAFKVPSGPPPVPPGNIVKPARHTEVKDLFKQHPDRVIVGGDSLEMHQYIWEYKNWADGKRVSSDAPAAFFMPNGQIRVHAGLWEREGGNIEEILDRSSPGRSGPTEFESAKTLPAGGGAGSTMGGSIAPGVGKKR